MSYADDTSIDILVSSDFVTREEAAHYAEMVIDPVGKLPMPMRKRLAHIVILRGNETAFAEDNGHFFVMYSENMNTRHDNNDLEATVFHESVHATLDEVFSASTEWMAAYRSYEAD